jgi:hypothetical protein
LFSTHDLDIIIDRYEIEGIRKNVNISTIIAVDDTASHYKGDYDIITNTPPLADGIGQIGDYYTLTTAGSRNFGSGSITFGVDDRIEYDGFLWFKAVNNNQSGGGGGGAVDSVDGLTGVLTTGAIVNSLTEKTTVVDDDLVGGSDSEASNVSKKWKFSTIATYVLGKIGAFLWGLTTKSTPVGADTITINDTQASNVLKKLTLDSLKTWLFSTSNSKYQIRAYYPRFVLTVDTWYSWNRNTSSMLTSEPTQTLGTGTEPTKSGTWFADTNCFFVSGVTELKKFTFAVRNYNANADIQLLVFKADYSGTRGGEPNGEYIINETFSHTTGTNSELKNNFTIATHTLEEDGSILQIFVRSPGSPTIQGVQFILDFE